MFRWNLTSSHKQLSNACAALTIFTACGGIVEPAYADNKVAAAKSVPSDKKGKSNDASEPAAAPENMKDGAVVIDKWLQAAQSFPSYRFDYKMTVYKPNAEVTEVGEVYFKRPRLLKIVETAGPKKGSVAILGPNGKVKAHGGGGFKFINVELSPDSGYLKSTNGWPMVKSDFASLAQAVKEYIASGDTPRMSAPISVPGKSEKLILFELHKGGAKGELFKRAYFDPNNNLPVEWWDYKDGKLWAHSVWTDFQSTELADATFTMKWKGDK